MLTVGPPFGGDDEVERPLKAATAKRRKDEHGQDDHGRGGGLTGRVHRRRHDDIGPLFDWLGSGDIGWSLPGSEDEARTSRASADFMTSHYANTAANVIGRRLFDLLIQGVRRAG